MCVLALNVIENFIINFWIPSKLSSRYYVMIRCTIYRPMCGFSWIFWKCYLFNVRLLGNGATTGASVCVCTECTRERLALHLGIPKGERWSRNGRKIYNKQKFTIARRRPTWGKEKRRTVGAHLRVLDAYIQSFKLRNRVKTSFINVNGSDVRAVQKCIRFVRIDANIEIVCAV